MMPLAQKELVPPTEGQRPADTLISCDYPSVNPAPSLSILVRSASSEILRRLRLVPGRQELFSDLAVNYLLAASRLRAGSVLGPVTWAYRQAVDEQTSQRQWAGGPWPGSWASQVCPGACTWGSPDPVLLGTGLALRLGA